jgi:parallel beta-helix repeat protein
MVLYWNLKKMRENRLAAVVCVCICVALLLVASPAQAQAATIWYVDDSSGADFTTIQDAVNASTDGDTIIVRDGTYIENVVVNKRSTISSENGSDLTTIQPATSGFDTPIFKLTMDYVNISGFTVDGLGPLTYDPEMVGKALSHGIAIDHANHCTITETTALGCAYGIHVGWYTNNNTVSQNNCSWNRDHGIKLDYSSDNTISHNICRGTWHDDNIDLTGSTNNVVSDNICSDGLDDGIYLWSGSLGNMIVNNTCENNAECGIRSYDGGNIISNNTCSGNSMHGIYIGSGNTVTYNTVLNNVMGFWIVGSNGTIYLNNIIDYVHAISSNTWNSTEQLTYTYNGNTYTNYLGNYLATYPGNDTDGDGIGDTPCHLEGTEYDYRPLMEPVENYSILTSIAVSPSSATLYPGTTQQFTATAYDQTHQEMPGVGVAWSSSNETVGTIDSNGLFAALAPGTAEISAANGSVNGTATVTVTVLPAPITLWGPYVAKTTTNATVINWKTENATTGTVQYATDVYYKEQSTYEQTVADTEEIHLHHLNITNLTPDTVYHYQVCIGNESTGDCTFRTFPLSGSFTFIVYGDSQEPQGEPGATQLTRHKLVADRIAEEDNVSFVLHVGDLVNDGSDLEEWNRFFEAARAMMSTTTFYTTLGNHEYASYGGGSGDPEQNYYDAFEMPEWYSFDCGDAHFTVLDSNDQADVNAETAWLQADLGSDSATNATWKFVSFHHPPYSSSAKNYGGWTYFRGLWCPLFPNHSVIAVFNGHVHAYERLTADGIHYVVVGIGGGPIYDLAEPRIPESQNSLEWTLGYVKITIDAEAEQVTLEMIAVANLSSGEVVLDPPHTVFETAILWQAPGLCGDVNGDGVVNVLDATKVKNRAGNPSYPLDDEWAADVNGDGSINVLDATKVKNRAGDPGYPLDCCTK